MSEQTMSIRMTEERGDRLRRVMEATGKNTKAKALDLANKERVADDLSADLAGGLSTP